LTKVLILINILSSFASLKEASMNRIIVKFEGPENFATTAYDDKGRSVLFLLGDMIMENSENAPLVPYFDIKIALNEKATYRCKINPLTSFTYSEVLLPTVPTFTNDGLTMNYLVYVGDKTPKEQLIYTGETEIINGIPTAHIFFTPYIYDPQARRLSYVREAEIEIDILETKERSQLIKGWYDAILEKTFLNYEGILARESKIAPSNPFDNGAIWFQIKITQEGYYTITFSDLQNAGLPYPFSIGQTALYIRNVDTLPSVPPSDSAVFFKKIPFNIVDKNQDGIFNGEDEISFFCPGPQSFRTMLQGTESSPSEIISKATIFRNPYTDTVSVWVTFGAPGDLMEKKNLNFTNTVNSLFSTYHYEKDIRNIAWKGLLWVGEEVIRDSSRSAASIDLNFTLPSPADGQGFIRIRYAGGENTFRQFKAVVNGRDTISDVSNGLSLRTIFKDLSSLQSSNTLKIILSSQNIYSRDKIYLDYFSIFFKRNTNTFEDEMAFFGEPETLDALFQVHSNVKAVLDITDPFKPSILELQNTEHGFYVSDTLYPGKCFYFVTTTKRPTKIELIPNAGKLYELGPDINYIAITPKAFVSSLLKFKNYREKNLLKFEGGKWVKSTGKVAICTVEDIMQDFGFGTYDPVALRNFLKYQHEKSSGNLIYIGLFGDACYDYKNINGTGGNLVPAYEPFLSTNIEEEKGAKDDFYVDFNGDGYGDLLVGRIPFRTKEELNIYLDKLYKYEENVVFSNWRSRSLFIADDEYGEAGRPTEIGFHIPFANYIRVDTVLTPPFCEVALVYETSYGVSGNSVDLTKRGRDAKSDYIRKFNNGNFITTFFGHGNPVQLTHEQLFMLQDLPLLDARYKNPISMFLSCKVGAFTRENPPMGIGEYMSIYRQSIGTIASTIGQFVSINYFFGRDIHQELADRQLHPLGQVVSRAKLSSIYLTYYHLFGDPATIVYLPNPDTLTDIIPEDTIWIARLNSISLNNIDYTGEHYVTFFHKPYIRRYTNPSNPSVTVEYLGENRVLYKAPFRFTSSIDSVVFFMPGTADTGRGFCFSVLKKKDNKISTVYASNMLTALGNISTEDKEGPKIQAYINGEDVSKLKEAPLSFNIKAVLSDSSGINLFDVFAEEKGIMLLVDNNFLDLTPYFEFYSNSYTTGEVNYPYASSQLGRKDFKLIAYDNLNNFSQLSFSLDLKTTANLFSNILIYPNPVSGYDRVYFTFRLNQAANVKIEIYTISGRKIYQIPEVMLPQGFNELHWNLRDMYGEAVSNGLYLVKLTFKNSNEVTQEVIKGFVIGK